MKLKFLAIIVAVSLVFAFPGVFVSASNFDFQISPSILSVCPCSSITPQNVQISITNLYQFPDTYSFVIDAPQGFTSQVQQNLVINSGDTRKLDLFMINSGCSVTPGEYHISVKAKSGTTGEVQTKTLDIDVLNCYEVQLTADNKFKEMCTEEGPTTMYYLNVQNKGKYTDTYSITASVPWATFSDSKITVDPGKTKSVALALTPPAGTKGLQFINIQAKSENYQSSDSDTVQLNVQDCYSMTADLQPTQSSVCLGESATQKLTITNTGTKADNYSVSVPSWVSADKTVVSLAPKASATVNLILKPSQKGKTFYNITVASAKDATLARIFPADVNAQECKGVAVIISPTQTYVCQGVQSDFIVYVKNLGSIQDTFSMTASAGSLEATKVIVNPGEIKQLKLTVPNSTAPGTYTIRVKAQSGDVSDQGEVKTVVENCYSASIDLGPQNISVCFNTLTNYTVAVKNTGKLADNYTLAFSSIYGTGTRTFSLNPTEVRIEEFGVRVPSEPQSGTLPVTATLQSSHTGVTKQTNLIVRPKESCYSVQIISADDIKIPICNASTLTVTIKNSGEKRDNYTVSLSGPDWAYVSPNAVSLAGGQHQEVYVYLSPCYGAELHEYSVKVKVSSPTIQIQKTVNVEVANTTTSVVIPTPQGQNGTVITIPANGSGNASVTGLIFGLDSGAWKVIAIAVITIIIIIILAIRFILLAKK